jgi:hypothetical protein
VSSTSNLNATATPAAAAIENELPAYRAIHPMAVVSLLLGVLSILSFASPIFIAIAVAAIAAGALATQKIRRYPDAFTGRGLANAGIALGLSFGLAAATTLTVTSLVRSSRAKVFAAHYRDVLKKGTKDDLVWYTTPPAGRKGKTPQQIVEQISQGKEQMMYETQNHALFELKKAVDAPGADIHFVEIEATADDGNMLYANAVYEIHSPEAKNADDKEQFALALMKATEFEGQYAWWVESVQFPYKRGTHVQQAAPVDDGHGHGH